MGKFGRYSARATLVLLEIIAGLSVIVLIGALFFAWRINHSPVNLNFLSTYITDDLSDYLDTEVEVKNIYIVWPEWIGPLHLEMTGVKVGAQRENSLSVEELDIGLAGLPLLQGKVQPVSIKVMGPLLRVIRNIDNKFSEYCQMNTMQNRREYF